MSRKAKPEPTALAPAITTTPAEMLAGTELLQRHAADVVQLRERLQAMGITQEYSPAAFEALAHGQVEVMRNSAITLGGLLAMLRANETAEHFAGTLERLGLSRSSAYRCIAVFTRFSALPGLAQMGSSKCIELLAVDDETLRQIEAGELAGITANSLGEMSVRELRDQVKKLREQVETKDQLLAKKQQRITELSDKLDMVESDRLERFAAAVETIQAQVTECVKQLTRCEEQLTSFERLEEELQGAPQGVRDQIYQLREMLLERAKAVAV